MKVYSFRDLTGAFSHPLLSKSLVFAGQIGAGKITVAMATEKTVQDVAADGTVQVSAIPGDNGTVTIEVQQTSAIHDSLLDWYNKLKVQMDAGDVAEFATAALTFRELTTGRGHVCTGISPGKLPDKAYASQAQSITWTLHCADIQNS